MSPHVNAAIVYALRHEELNADQIASVTTLDVADAVTLIRSAADAPESDADMTAHQMESALRRNVLRAVAGGHPNGQGLAQVALSSERIGFVRWFG